MKYCLWILLALLLSAGALQAAETNVFFTIHPEGRTGNQPPEPEPSWGGGGGGGGGAGNLSLPSAPIAPTTGAVGSEISALQDAYEWAKFNGITSASSFNEASMNMPITRIELARALVWLVRNAVGITVITPNKCDLTTFSDYDKIKESDRIMAQQACDWGLIGRKSGRTQQLDTYNPSGLVTRSQFVSILARLLYGYTYDENPSQALLVFKEIGYINDISAPNILERRGTMLLVLQRIAASWDKKVRTLNPELLGVRSLTGVYLPPVKTPVFTWKTATWTQTAPIAEFLDAYQWAKQYNLTTDSVYNEANMFAPLRRVDLARMMVLFAQEVWTTQTLHLRKCNVTTYKDYATMSNETISWVEQACNIGVMGRNADRSKLIEYFNPQGVVNRAEFATVLSRFLYGSKYNNTETPESRYVTHLQALKAKGYINKIDTPFMQELKGYVLLIMKRIADQKTSL